MTWNSPGCWLNRTSPRGSAMKMQSPTSQKLPLQSPATFGFSAPTGSLSALGEQKADYDGLTSPALPSVRRSSELSESTLVNTSKVVLKATVMPEWRKILEGEDSDFGGGA